MNDVCTDKNLINLSEYIETLIGNDDWCGQDIEDRNVVDLTDDDILDELGSRHCLRYMNGYRLSLIEPELDYAFRKYKGHRMIPAEKNYN